MGCFDSVVRRCACGQDVEWQTKAGDCRMEVWRDLEDVPLPVLGSLAGTARRCACGRQWRIRVQMLATIEEDPD